MVEVEVEVEVMVKVVVAAGVMVMAMVTGLLVMGIKMEVKVRSQTLLCRFQVAIQMVVYFEGCSLQKNFCNSRRILLCVCAG